MTVKCYKLKTSTTQYSVVLARIEAQVFQEVLRLVNDVNRRSSKTGILMQAIRDDCVINPKHVLAILYHSIEAFYRKSNIADKLYMEILLRISGVRQIKDAIRVAGISEAGVVWIICLSEKADCSMLLQFLNSEIKNMKNIRLLDFYSNRPALQKIISQLNLDRKTLESLSGELEERAVKAAIMRAALMHII